MNAMLKIFTAASLTDKVRIPYAGRAKSDSKAGAIVSILVLPKLSSGVVFFHATLNNDEKGFFAPSYLITAGILAITSTPDAWSFSGSKPDGGGRWIIEPGGMNVSGRMHHFTINPAFPFQLRGSETRLVAIVRGNVRPGFLTRSDGGVIGCEDVNFGALI